MSQIFKPSTGGGGTTVTSVTGANGVTASPTTGAVVVSGVNATTSSVGVASFNPAEFTVTGGEVSDIPITVTGGTGISITGSPVNLGGTLTISSSSSVATLYTENSGTATPAANNLNVLGTGSITTAGAGSTITVELTGLTNHAVLVGAGSTTITNVGPTAVAGQVLQSQGSTTDPAFSTATYPSTTTINQILYSSAANVVSGLATANNGVLTTGTTGIPVITALPANGQLIIGSGSGAPLAATLTAGSGITITNAANSITISNTNASGFPWTDVLTATQALATNNGYVTDHTNVTYTLPATAVLGDTIKIVGKLGITTVDQNATQQIVMSSSSTTVGTGGSIAGTNVGDCVELICITAGTATVWRGFNFVGNWTIT